jgi:hypothetical protein
MKIKCVDNGDGFWSASLEVDKIYEAKLSSRGYFAITGEMGDKACYPLELLILVTHTKRKYMPSSYSLKWRQNGEKAYTDRERIRFSS